MPKFQVNDAVSIKEYIKSLDTFEQFDEVSVQPVENRNPMSDGRIQEAWLEVKSLDKVICRHKVSRDFYEPVFEFSSWFEQDMKYLSAAILFARKLLDLDDTLTNFKIDTKDFWTAVMFHTNESSYESLYECNVSVNASNEAVSSIMHKFKSDADNMTCTHIFETKSVIKIEELESVVNEFVRLRAGLTKKGD